MRWLLPLLVACAQPPTALECSADGTALLMPPADAAVPDVAPPAPAPPPPPVWKAAAPVVMPPPVVQPAAAGAIIAAPSGQMRALAVTHDGTAAASVDVDGHVRLWPSLDGSLEPLVIAMRRPVSLAILRAGQDFVIAGLDGAGQLELVELGPLGQPLWRKPVELPRPAIDIRATQQGFLVERDDQHLVFVDLGARLEGEVEPPPGTDVAAIAVSSDRMFALLSSDGAIHGRWLVVDGSLQWGDQTAKLPLAPHAVALSPDSRLIAGVIETATTTQLAVIKIDGAKRIAVGPENQVVDPPHVVRFIDDDTILFEESQTPFVWHTEDNSMVGLIERGSAAVPADGGPAIVIGITSELMIADRAGTAHYLGFRVASPTMVTPGAHSLLASDGQRVLRLGADLRVHASYEVSPLDAGLNVMALLDQTHALAQTYRDQAVMEVVALDTLDVKPLEETGWLGYDPATRLAAFLDNQTVRFRRFDPKTGDFGPAAELEAESTSSSVMFTDGGAFVTTYTDTGYVTRTVTRIRPERGTLVVARTHKQPFTAPAEAVLGPYFERTVRSPDGREAASIGAGRISLRDAHGNTRWTVPANGAYNLAWLSSGELIAIGSGLAQIAPETGSFGERRCGWEFGLWPQRNDGIGSATICDAE